jgi:saccharopine dehydrogenase-like NADP-dependent oxidoreductase
MERWGFGGGVMSTAAPAAAAARLLARGEITGRGVLPPESCIEPQTMFAELVDRGCRVQVATPEEVRA